MKVKINKIKNKEKKKNHSERKEKQTSLLIFWLPTKATFFVKETTTPAFSKISLEWRNAVLL